MSIHVNLICSWINFMAPLSCVLKNCFYSLLELGLMTEGRISSTTAKGGPPVEP
jgi:hypothetical protein